MSDAAVADTPVEVPSETMVNADAAVAVEEAEVEPTTNNVAEKAVEKDVKEEKMDTQPAAAPKDDTQVVQAALPAEDDARPAAVPHASNEAQVAGDLKPAAAGATQENVANEEADAPTAPVSEEPKVPVAADNTANKVLAPPPVAVAEPEFKSEKPANSLSDSEKEAPKAEKRASESTKDDSAASDSPRKQQKASFNIDAKPFSPAPLSDPVLQGTLVGEANGISIKVGQWGPQPYVPLPHISPVAPVSVGQPPYAMPSAPPPAAVRKETAGVKESLSAFAKPWSPHPEVTVTTIPTPDNEVAIHPGSWTTVTLEGKVYQTPSPMVPKETSSNTFVHSYAIHPKGLRSVELELFNYVCGRCPLKTLYGRLSSRQPDVTMRNVSMDVPPLCVAHLIEQITKAKVTALCVNDVEGSHYDIWLDKPNMAPNLTEAISGCVWTCPMHHGYAVLGKGEEGKKYLRNYVERLKDSKPEGSNVYDVALVEVKEH